jgi:hypothetical protein
VKRTFHWDTKEAGAHLFRSLGPNSGFTDGQTVHYRLSFSARDGEVTSVNLHVADSERELDELLRPSS